MLDPEDVKVLDLNSAWHGVPPSHLMQNAGRAVAEVVLGRFEPMRTLVVAGLGNNGGDGAVAASILAEQGVAVTLLYAGDPEKISTPEARLALANVDRSSVRVEAYRSAERLKELLADAELVVDALLGVGVRGELRDLVRGIVRAVNASRRPVLAVDVPTGLGTGLHTHPKATVTLHAKKAGMAPKNSGAILVRSIGIPEAAREVGPGDLAVHYPRPDAKSHKGQNGQLLAVLGGPYTGAPILASEAALRTGCDLVRLYAPEEAAEAAQAHSPDLIVKEGVEDQRLVPEDLQRLRPWLDRSTAVLVGSGIGTDRSTVAFVGELLAETRRRKLPIVLDADALAVAGRRPELLRGRPVLCTPHAGEFKALAGRAAPADEAGALRAAIDAARRLRATLLLKGHPAVATDGRRSKLSRVHVPGLTAGGIGDVLAGACAGLVAKGLDPYRSALAASFLVGAASRNAFDVNAWGARATDVLAQIGPVLRAWVPLEPGAPTGTV